MPLPIKQPRVWLTILHWVIIINFALEIAYAFHQVFFVMAPDGVIGPLGDAAKNIPADMMLARRLYAIEGWLGIIGLSLYLGITEILPRKRQFHERPSTDLL